MRKAVYPGSFDPLTNGHVEVIRRSLSVVDHLTIAVLKNSSKKSLFHESERIEIIKEVFSGPEFADRIYVESFTGLLVDYCRNKDIPVVIRGLRAVSDFDYEHAIFLMNRNLYPEFETLFFMSGSEHSFISSTIVKEVSSWGGDVSAQVPQIVQERLRRAYESKA